MVGMALSLLSTVQVQEHNSQSGHPAHLVVKSTEVQRSRTVALNQTMKSTLKGFKGRGLSNRSTEAPWSSSGSRYQCTHVLVSTTKGTILPKAPGDAPWRCRLAKTAGSTQRHTAPAAPWYGMVSLLLCLLSGAVIIQPSSARQPLFSWEKIPTFWHAGNASGPLNSTLLQFVASKGFAMATVEKMQAIQSPPMSTDAEAKITQALLALKNASAGRISTCFYLNSVMDWPEYNLHRRCANQPEIWLRDLAGDYVYIKGPGSGDPLHVFDLANGAAREAWLDVLRDARAAGIDGAFVDRGNTNATAGTGGAHGWNLSAAHKAAWDAGHVAMLQEAGKIFANGVVIGNNQYYPGVNGRMFESFGNDFTDGWAGLPRDIEALTLAQGGFVEVHGEPRELGKDEACPDDVFNVNLAAYVVGAQENQYYFCSDGWTVQNGWDKWRPEFDRPLGSPRQGRALQSPLGDGNMTYTRHFASGTWAYLRCNGLPGDTPLGCVCWSGGEVTGPSGCEAVCRG